jgi:PPOX class probable F420-dependent enzyme
VTSGRLVHLVTIDADGGPQVSCVYATWDGDEIVAGHLSDYVKLRNIRRNPQVSLSIESDLPSEGVFSPYLVINGTARVQEGGAVEVLRRITDGAFPPKGDWPDGFVTRITPQKIAGTGPWKVVD